MQSTSCCGLNWRRAKRGLRDGYEPSCSLRLRDSAEIMGKYGHEPKLSGKRYEEVLADTQKTFQTLSTKNK